MADIVALQGGSQDGGNSGEDSSNNGLVFIGEALEEMVNQKRMDFEGVQKTDLHWRSAKRTALRGVTNSEQLRKRIKLLIRLQEKVVKYTIKSTRNHRNPGPGRLNPLWTHRTHSNCHMNQSDS
jgi:hypothetical protein